jgi:hypothetical protein
MVKRNYSKPKTAYSTKPSFSLKSKTKSGNVMVTKGWSKKGESKIVKTIGYKTRNSKYGKSAKKKMVITTMKKLTSRRPTSSKKTTKNKTYGGFSVRSSY